MHLLGRGTGPAIAPTRDLSLPIAAYQRVRARLVAVPLTLLLVLSALPLLAVAAAPGEDAAPIPGVSPRVLAAYRRADGRCEGLRWELLAGIGWVESQHGTANGASVEEGTGLVLPPILGPPLDGRTGPALQSGAWRGQWGLAGPWQQALGPMQLLPGTFAAWAVDGDGDGILDPHDIDDAVATAANYLCGSAGEIVDERAALFRYNRSDRYVTEVLDYADSLAAGGLVVGSGWLCPIAGRVSFTDTWLAPRPGGRQHKGVDMFAARGTPVVAPVAGTVEFYNDSLGGLSFRLWGADGNFYYGTHLAGYGPRSGDLNAGAVIGYVGDTGNAAGTGAHLHFEIHPGRRRGDPPSPVNPTPTVADACATSRTGPAISGGA